MAEAEVRLPAAHSPRWLVAPFVAVALVSFSVGLLAREEAIAPGTDAVAMPTREPSFAEPALPLPRAPPAG